MLKEVKPIVSNTAVTSTTNNNTTKSLFITTP